MFSAWVIFLASASIALSEGRLSLNGQTFFEQTRDDRPSFVARSRDVSVALQAGTIEFGVSGTEKLKMRLTHGRLPEPEGVSLLPGRVNHLVGPESAWRKNDLRFSSVRYRNVYHGVDLVFHGSQNKLEYDFIVAPGADPSAISVRWEGAEHLSLGVNGELQIARRGANMEWHAPVLYQETADGERRPVRGSFRIEGRDRVSFTVGEYDHRLNLVIDPSLVFSTYLGGSQFDLARGVAVDAAGNAYVSGGAKSIDLPVTKGAFQTAYAGGTGNLATGDVFVAKYSSSGTLVYLTYLGGAKDDIALAVAADAAGSAYVTGYTNSLDFPVTSNAFQQKYAGAGGNTSTTLGDAFVTKLSPDGSSLVYSTYLGGQVDDIGFGIAVDSSGSAYVTGMTLSQNFPTTAGAFQTKNHGSGGQETFPIYNYGPALLAGDAFVTKLDPTGSKLVYSTLLGGLADDCAQTIAVDSSGNAYIGGYTLSTTDFPLVHAAQSKFGGFEPQNYFFTFGDAFVAKFDPTGSTLIFSTFLGGGGDDQVSAIAVDAAGNSYVTGSTTSLNFPLTPGVFQKGYHGPMTLPFYVDQLFGDAFVTKYDPNGTMLLSTYLGGSNDDVGHGIAVDGAGNILVAGATASPDFAVTSGAAQTTFAGPSSSSLGNIQGDGFLAVLNPAGTAQTYSTFFGGTLDDVFMGLALSPTGTAWMTGGTASTNFPVLHPSQAARGAPNAVGVNRSDAIVTAISGFTPSSTAGTTPVITSVVSATGETPGIGQNTWTEIKGINLVSASTPAAGVIWSSAPSFLQGLMPTQLGGVSVTVDGNPAFIYFYCSSKTNSSCASDQINILTPLDSTTGGVQVQVTGPNGVASSTAQLQKYAPGFFQFNGGPYVAATHVDGTLVGPATLYPGASTPAAAGETIVLYINGLGQTTPPVVNGSATQTGTLPTNPTVTIANVPATIQFAGVVAPGLYQLNVIMPAVASGDDFITLTYNGFTSQTGAKITIK
jgi:uncharacterized protein (TIGR03437 family)